MATRLLTRVDSFARLTQRYSLFAIRRAVWIVAVACVLSAVGAFYSVLLYRNLRTDLEELLPTTARSVVDLKQVKDRLRSTQNLAILVFSKNKEASRRFIDDLVARIPGRLGSDLDRVEFKINREVQFFKEKRPLFIETQDLERIRNYVRDRIDYEKELYNPLNIFRSEEIRVPSLNFGGLERKYSDKVSAYTRFKDGYYANADETIRAVLVYLRGAVGITVSKRVTEKVWNIIDQLNPKSYSPDMNVRFAGDVEDFVEEHSSLIGDLTFSTFVVIFLVTGAMLAYYRDVRTTAALILSLLMGTLWTFGAAYFAVGYLNANSAFMGSIVMGNGINFGIIVLARYLELRRRSVNHVRAMIQTVQSTSTPTLTAALAAGLSYGSLASTTFRGFHQFGIIGLMGMMLCWIAAFSVMPALITLIEERWPRVIHPVHRVGGGFSNGVAHLIQSAPRVILAVSILALFASGVAMIVYRGQIIESDTTKLRDRWSMQSGSGYLSRYLDEVFGRYITPLIILADNPQDMDAIKARIKEYQARTGKAGLISQVYSLHDFVPTEQAKKLQILGQIRSILKPSIFAKLNKKDQKKVREILPKKDPVTFGVNDLPPLVLDRFRLKSGGVGDLVIVEPVVTEKAALADFVNQYRLVTALRDAADAVRPGTPVVGTLPVTVDMFQSIRSDGPRATAIAFLSVVVLVLILFRHAATAGLTLLSLVLGVSWLLGAIFAFNLKINFLNFIALPITFGIGVDYAVNIVQRYRTDGSGKVLEAVKGTGGAVALASLTTIIGYSSLLLASNQAFFSFGRLAILGEIMTLSAALLSLPAYIYLRDRRQVAQVQKLEIPVRREVDQRPAA